MAFRRVVVPPAGVPPARLTTHHNRILLAGESQVPAIAVDATRTLGGLHAWVLLRPAATNRGSSPSTIPFHLPLPAFFIGKQTPQSSRRSDSRLPVRRAYIGLFTGMSHAGCLPAFEAVQGSSRRLGEVDHRCVWSRHVAPGRRRPDQPAGREVIQSTGLTTAMPDDIGSNSGDPSS